MVEVIYDGNLGNNLFQYCFGRILATQLGYALKADAIAGFVGTEERIVGKNFEGERQRVLRGQKADLSFLNEVNPRYHILLTGYFQRSEYYLPFCSDIKGWLKIDYPISEQIAPDDVVVGIRRGTDYIPQHGLPLSYYENALQSLRYKRVHLCSNDPKDQFVRYLAKKYRATIRPPGAVDNFAFIQRFSKIIISNSTFLWWAAFLSRADRIIVPRPQNGFWSENDPISLDIDLRVPEPRYVYQKAKQYEAEFFRERVFGASSAGYGSLKRLMQRIFPILKKLPPTGKFRFTDP